jgi:subtilisin family serine protease
VTYYHRGSSPTRATGFINVGAIDTIMTTPAIERKSSFSETGPRVDIYAPGSMVMGAYANKAYSTGAVPDPRNGLFYLNKVSGTSMACPQVTGVLACFLQARPTATAADCLTWLIENSTPNALNENPSGGTGYSNNFYLQGGNNRVLHQPFKSSTRGSITS